MKIENGKIKECTEHELFCYWLPRYSEIMSFDYYMWLCIKHGTIITEVDNDLYGND